ncbi:nucleotide exchange factor GrpE [Dendrosporobacter sp. 1207_IL3150]|uniref:nucleotide exchange factor GrpE n=1 Tax=Dendrosporobacter sp. 1207_IL3150 TaxID=3084054 RepID=UPI002FDAA57F
MTDNKEKDCSQEIVDEKSQAVENSQEVSSQEVCFDYTEVEQMMTVIEEKNRLLQEHAERVKRLQADFDNFRRRTRQEKEDLSSLVTQNLIKELLPLLDNFERAMATEAAQDAAAIRSGVEMMYRQFSSALEKNGLEQINAVGQTFDPQFHEAIMRVDDCDKPEGTIVEELQKGYIVRGKVVRPSMVKVVG